MEHRRRLLINGLKVGAFLRTCLGESISGDTVVLEHRDNYLLLAIVDGMGHGREANAAATQAERILQKSWNLDVRKTIRNLHSSMTDSIGAAVGLAVVDIAASLVHYTGVGNTVFRVFGTHSSRFLSTDGVVGSRMREPILQTTPIDGSDVLIMYTDGVSDHFGIEQYPQILCHSALAVAHKIVERFGKAHDDATCLVMRYDR